MLQNAHNEIFDFLVDEATRCFVHFVTHCGNMSSYCFCKRQSAVFALTGYAMLCSAKPTSTMLRVLFARSTYDIKMSGNSWSTLQASNSAQKHGTKLKLALCKAHSVDTYLEWWDTRVLMNTYPGRNCCNMQLCHVVAVAAITAQSCYSNKKLKRFLSKSKGCRVVKSTTGPQCQLTRTSMEW